MAHPPQAGKTAVPAKSGTGGSLSTGTFLADQLQPDSTSYPPTYEAAILYAADHYDAAEAVLKEHLKTADGKNSLRTWLMLFDYYQLTNNRKEFDALSLLFTVKFERSPPLWLEASDSSDPRRKEKRERKDFFPMQPAADGSLSAEIAKFEKFAKEMGSARVDFGKVKTVGTSEAEALASGFQRLRKAKIPIWFNGLDPFIAILKAGINEKTGRPLGESQGYWSLLFELFILDNKLQEYEELGLEYAVAFEMSPPAWEAVNRPTGNNPANAGAAAPAHNVAIVGGFPLKGVVSATSKEMLQQLSLHAASKPEVIVDLSDLLRIDFAAAGMFFEAIRAINLSQKRIVLSNVNEMVAALLEVFGMTKHALLIRKKTT